ncbi:MAG: hypothetical protein FOGNACKC_04706 [Anaerolineae bacterium]|nr:hypothetical protein [Anaerolineae bacterium]
MHSEDLAKLLLIGFAATTLLSACGSDTARAEVLPSPTVTTTPTPSPTATVTPTPLPQPTATPSSLCEPAFLWAGQTLSASGSFTETETSAAGPMVCQIAPGSCEYHRLVGQLDPTIVFKKEEEPPFDREDIMMHPSMLYPLNRLNELVRAEWGGQVQLRVTDAYDSLLEHDLAQTDDSRKYSLHFEGRSVDLTTWPVDLNRYARLCALAHCAGFDWVQNEGDHCHASVNAESLCGSCGN